MEIRAPTDCLEHKDNDCNLTKPNPRDILWRRSGILKPTDCLECKDNDSNPTKPNPRVFIMEEIRAPTDCLKCKDKDSNITKSNPCSYTLTHTYKLKQTKINTSVLKLFIIHIYIILHTYSVYMKMLVRRNPG